RRVCSSRRRPEQRIQGTSAASGAAVRNLVSAADNGLAFSEPGDLPRKTECRAKIVIVVGDHNLAGIGRVRSDKFDLSQRAWIARGHREKRRLGNSLRARQRTDG